MYPLTHLILSLILVLFLRILNVLSPIYLLIILLSALLIDVDHWFVYVIKKKDFSISKSYKWFIALSKLKKQPKFLCIFHTVEFFILIIILSLKFEFFQMVLIGMIFHMALDILDSIKEREYMKEISLIYAVLKRR